MTTPSFESCYATLPPRFYSRVSPARVPDPALIQVNDALADSLGLDPVWLRSQEGLSLLSGSRLPSGVELIAQAYGGHQFGGWVPQLGDGRAMLLGELRDGDGSLRDVQLKGSGRTPYSRGGDGKAPLGAVLREYLVSEAMHGLGVPTTRALAAVSTGEEVVRQSAQPGAILTRVAASHVRVGTFQYFYAQQDQEALKILADFVIGRHYSEAMEGENPYVELLRGVIRNQARLIAQWMQLGFIHGVMNTDNMAISGETIDYGPCAFMDGFHAERVFSSIDRGGRYAWINQPVAGNWNLARFSETLLGLFADEHEAAVRMAEACLVEFEELFNDAYFRGFAEKMALPVEHRDSGELVQGCLELMEEYEIDFTRFFTYLTERAGGSEDLGRFSDLKIAGAAWQAWFANWEQVRDQGEPAVARMREVNPVLIPRNHLIASAIEKAEGGDVSLFHRLNEAWQQPYADRADTRDLQRSPAEEERVRVTFCGT